MKNISVIIFIGWLLFACDAKQAQQSAVQTQQYTCPMHPNVLQDGPGQCPVCHMDLVPVSTASEAVADNVLMLGESQIKLANIRTTQITEKPIGESVMFNATLTTDASKTEGISARAAGRIEKLIIKENGRKVRAGEALYTLYSETLLTLQREYLLAKEQAAQLGSEDPRYKGFVQSAEKKLKLYGMTDAQIAQLKSVSDLQPRVTLVAPVSGVVTSVKVTEGQYVSEGTLMFTVENLNTLWVETELYPHESKEVQVGDPVQIAVRGYEGTPAISKIIFMSPEYRNNTQITTVRAALENSDGQFQPGMQAQVRFQKSSRKALTLPVDAVVRDSHGAHVYVQSATATFEPRMVRTGIEDFDQIEIVEGLKAGETVVISGAYLLYSEFILKKGVNPMQAHHHEHAE
jgi:Cu(I)/Ag(I) efflux system membrane fusion protein